MYPMDYEEFRWALGDVATVPLLSQFYEKRIPLGQALRKSMRDFRLYMLVGGMPQAVNEYLNTNNLSRVDKEKRKIINLYLDDFLKIDPSGRASRLFRAIPSELSKNASRYQVGSVLNDSERKNLDEVLEKMRDSMTVNFAYHSNDPNVGLSLNCDMNQYKMFVGDTGLFVTLAFWDKDVTENVIYEKLLSDKLSANLGYVYENIVAQVLTAKGCDCATFRDQNPVSGNFWNGVSSSDYSRSGWCPGTATNPVYFDLNDLKPGTHTLRVAIPQGKDEGGSFSHWMVSGVVLYE